MQVTSYQKVTSLLKPLIMLYVSVRKRKGKEDVQRFNERLGVAAMPRPKGRLVWLHGASVGETVSMLPLITKMREEYPRLNVLVTSGTVTSAKIMAGRLPKGVIHQYVPLDIKEYTDKFISHWKPDLALWFESDFWPNLIVSASEAKVPLILVNGRISDRSFAKWQKAKSFIAELQSKFALSLGQTKEDARRLKKLGARNALSVGNIKYAAGDLPYDAEKLADLQKQIIKRENFAAASTHNDEESRLADIFLSLKQKHPSLLLIIVPRHPKRGAEIIQNLKAKGLKVALRSKDEKIAKDTDIYIADTIGEMGIFYRLSDIVFMGGSLVPHGGQNFLEPARLKSAIVVGSFMHNFTEMTRNAVKAKAIIQVKDDKMLAVSLEKLLKNKKLRQKYIANGARFALNEGAVLDRVFAQVAPYINIIVSQK